MKANISRTDAKNKAKVLDLTYRGAACLSRSRWNRSDDDVSKVAGLLRVAAAGLVTEEEIPEAEREQEHRRQATCSIIDPRPRNNNIYYRAFLCIVLRFIDARYRSIFKKCIVICFYFVCNRKKTKFASVYFVKWMDAYVKRRLFASMILLD